MSDTVIKGGAAAPDAPKDAEVSGGAEVTPIRKKFDFAAKACPIFSLALVRQQQSRLVHGMTTERPPIDGAEASACLGPQCAWFLSEHDPQTGELISGGCAVMALPVQQNQSLGFMAKTIGAILDKLKIRIA